MTETTELICACGAVRLQTRGSPIMTVECLCTSCREASARLSSRAGFQPFTDAKGATGYVLYRKDRLACVQGAGYLKEHRLSPDRTTRRVIAICCHTPMFLEFIKGHWLSVYRDRWPPEGRPEVQLRTMTGDAAGIELPDDVPNARTHDVGFMTKLLLAWVKMGFRVPKVDYVRGSLDDSARERQG